MKRTGEIILTSIAFIFSFLGTLAVTFVLFFSNTDIFRNIFEEGFMEGAMEEEISVNPGDIECFLNVILGVGWALFIILIISLILGAISIYFFVGNKKPITASVIAIITAILITIGTALTAFVPGLLYLIAGIIGLVRKTPVTHDPHVAETELHWKQNNPDEFN